MSEKQKLLYIMGTGRSGSTILEILLAQGEGVFAAGELTALVQDGFIENKTCSCGSDCSSCEIWGTVLSELKVESWEFKEWAEVQKKVDWHDGFIKQILHLLPRKALQLYRKRNLALLDAIKRVTGSSVVLDSSKYAGRALALFRILRLDLKVICLTRAPIGLMTSFQKPNKDEQRPKSVMATLLYYCVTLTLLRIASLYLGSKVFPLHYEDLLADPEGTIKAIGQWSGIDFSKPQAMLARDESFHVGHLVTGNRLRKQKTIRFNAKPNVMAHDSFIKKMAVAVMNGWRWLLRF